MRRKHISSVCSQEGCFFVLRLPFPDIESGNGNARYECAHANYQFFVCKSKTPQHQILAPSARSARCGAGSKYFSLIYLSRLIYLIYLL